MNKGQKDSAPQAPVSKLLRPVLIASEKTISDYRIFLGHLLVGFADESIHTALVCPPQCNVDSIVPPAVEVIRDPAFNLPLMGYQNRKILIEKLGKFKPSVLHCLCESKAPLTKKIARQLGLPYVLTVNSLQRRFSRFSISSSRCAKITVPAKSIATNLVENYPRLSRRIEQINMGTFVGETSGCFSEPARLACMVTSAASNNIGEFENLLGAVRHLVLDGYEFMLAVISSGRTERDLRKSLTARGLLQIVVSVPRLEPRRSALSAGDIFIQPAASNAFNPLLLEAMSVGSAVAACKGGVDDLIIEGKTAVVFDPDDELSIYGSLQQLLNRRELARQLAESAQEHLRENYTVSKMISSTLRMYHDAHLV